MNPMGSNTSEWKKNFVVNKSVKITAPSPLVQTYWIAILCCFEFQGYNSEEYKGEKKNSYLHETNILVGIRDIGHRQ